MMKILSSREQALRAVVSIAIAATGAFLLQLRFGSEAAFGALLLAVYIKLDWAR